MENLLPFSLILALSLTSTFKVEAANSDEQSLDTLTNDMQEIRNYVDELLDGDEDVERYDLPQYEYDEESFHDESEDQIDEDGSKEEGSRSEIVKLLKTNYQKELSEVQSIIMSERPRLKAKKKERKEKIRTLLKKILKGLKDRGVPKVEIKGPLKSLLRGWQHDYLVQKYSAFVEIPDQLALEDGEVVDPLNGFQVVP